MSLPNFDAGRMLRHHIDELLRSDPGRALEICEANPDMGAICAEPIDLTAIDVDPQVRQVLPTRLTRIAVARVLLAIDQAWAEADELEGARAAPWSSGYEEGDIDGAIAREGQRYSPRQAGVPGDTGAGQYLFGDEPPEVYGEEFTWRF